MKRVAFCRDDPLTTCDLSLHAFVYIYASHHHMDGDPKPVDGAGVKDLKLRGRARTVQYSFSEETYNNYEQQVNDLEGAKSALKDNDMASKAGGFRRIEIFAVLHLSLSATSELGMAAPAFGVHFYDPGRSLLQTKPATVAGAPPFQPMCFQIAFQEFFEENRFTV
jgi:hypothetical protein